MSQLVCGDEFTDLETDTAYDGSSTYYPTTLLIQNSADHRLNRQVEVLLETANPDNFKGHYMFALSPITDGRTAVPSPKAGGQCYIETDGSVTRWSKVSAQTRARAQKIVGGESIDVLWPYADDFVPSSGGENVETAIFIGKPAELQIFAINDIPSCAAAELKVLDGAQVPPCDCKCPSL